MAGELLLGLPELVTELVDGLLLAVDRLLLAFCQLSKADGEESSFGGIERPRAVGIPEASKVVEDRRQLTREEGHPSARYAQDGPGERVVTSSGTR